MTLEAESNAGTGVDSLAQPGTMAVMGYVKARWIEAMQPTPQEWDRRWIAVEEQWPKHGSDVLVAYKAGQYVLLGVGEFDGTTVSDDGATVPYFKGIGGFEVTHWMPLPEPPEVK